MASESDIQAKIMLAIGGRPDVRIFRNHVGFGWSGQLLKQEGDRVLLKNARPATFGLAPGSADLIGWRSITIKPEHVGRKIAVFISGEVKALRGKAAEAQKNWARIVDAAGGLAAIWRTPAGAIETVEGALI
ncbi:hypothetical protein [Acidocella aminolytica]|uniref:VRR-NUC domain-containing protein n=1 Tax=Acidocella aminolytica 101 = DSM 11237 TaxID=1120923 RepID=A0A0D6PDS2_9PROT|nr:hypothetical protein [Acidocella aminolytica]GAN79807.1 hypothetical protein Aam_030_040 [Acidocella aminolytica 101 = DSM 11237]GBQ34317.1 hypothetical protein AA11237_0713 [Acidocella aminolytica 101 = DSM 11237]SHF36510.1 hypothetical protein SAMN02746095_02991 [Acidocella aminolytica 101 = DSM 11237]